MIPGIYPIIVRGRFTQNCKLKPVFRKIPMGGRIRATMTRKKFMANLLGV
jgi:hypothetical protein